MQKHSICEQELFTSSLKDFFIFTILLSERKKATPNRRYKYSRVREGGIYFHQVSNLSECKQEGRKKISYKINLIKRLLFTFSSFLREQK